MSALNRGTQRWIAAGTFVVVAGSLLAAQAAENKRAFRAASIQLNESGGGSATIRSIVQGRFSATNVTLFQLIRSAYGVQDYQVSNRPSWADSLHFDIEATADSAADSNSTPEHLQSLLEERFGLQYHRETKSGRVLTITVDKKGHKLKENSGPCEGPASACSAMASTDSRLDAERITIEQLAARLARTLNQPVVDQTGLATTFDFALTWKPDYNKPDDVDAISSAMRDQLGLRMEMKKGPVEAFVIDKVTKPSVN